MNLTQISAADLKQIISLVEQKEALQAQAAKIDAALGAFEAGASAAPAAPAALAAPATPAQDKPAPKAPEEAKAKPVSRRRAKRGTVKTAIVELVKAAGKPGIAVKDIAAKLGLNYNRVFNWFYVTGENVKEIKKVGPGTYAWVAASAPVAKAAATAKPAKSTAQKPAAKPTGKMKDLVSGLVKASGKAGITVKEVAERLGVNIHRVYVWFAGTGKNVREIKKVGPAKYAWIK